MSRIIYISIGVLIVAAAAMFGIGFLLNPTSYPTKEPTTTPSGSDEPLGGDGQSQSAVQAAYKEALDKNNFDNVKLYDTSIAGKYALQVWKGDNLGGEALLQFNTPQNKWIILDPGGGHWSVEVLVDQGVPQATAAALLAGLPK